MAKSLVVLLVLVLTFLTVTGILPVNAVVQPVISDAPVSGLVEDSWIAKAGMPQGGAAFGAAVVEGKIYAFGGYYYRINSSSYESDATFGEYNPATDTWTTKAPMPTIRIDFATAVYQNKIYIIGGEEVYNWPQQGTVEVYDPATNKWTNATPMPMPRTRISASVVNGKIYVIGGTPRRNPTTSSTNTTQVYDPLSDTWSIAASCPISVYGYASAVIDDKIYVIGGWKSSSSFGSPYSSTFNTNQIYDPANDKWTLGTPLPKAVGGAFAGATTGVMAPKGIYVFGGFDDKGQPIHLNQVYDPKTNSWTTGTEAPDESMSWSVAVLKDTLYLIGGQYSGIQGGPPGSTDYRYYSSLPYPSRTYQYIPFGYGTFNPIPTPSPSPSPKPTGLESPSFGVVVVAVVLTCVLIAGLALKRKRKSSSATVETLKCSSGSF